MVYAEFGGQTECIMGNSKIEIWLLQDYYQGLFIAYYKIAREYGSKLAPKTVP